MPANKASEEPEDSKTQARKAYGSPRVARLTEYMADREELGLWSSKIEASLFLAAFAAANGEAPMEISESEELGNFYSVQEQLAEAGELAAFNLIYGDDGESIDETLIEKLPGLMEAGAEQLEETLRGPTPVGGIIGLLDQLE